MYSFSFWSRLPSTLQCHKHLLFPKMGWHRNISPRIVFNVKRFMSGKNVVKFSVFTIFIIFIIKDKPCLNFWSNVAIKASVNVCAKRNLRAIFCHIFYWLKKEKGKKEASFKGFILSKSIGFDSSAIVKPFNTWTLTGVIKHNHIITRFLFSNICTIFDKFLD